MGGIGDLGECVQAPIARRFAPNDCSALAPLGACSQARQEVGQTDRAELLARGDI